MIFRHVVTKKPALFVVDSIEGWCNIEDENLIKVEKPLDLPDFPWCKHFNIPPSIIENQGNRTFSLPPCIFSEVAQTLYDYYFAEWFSK